MRITIEIQTTQTSLDSDWKSTPSQEIELKSVVPLEFAGKGDMANFVDPVTAVVTLSVATLAFRFFEYYKKKGEHGIQIDLRTTPATVTDLMNVPNGFIVVIEKNGKARIEQAKYDKPEQINQILEKIFGELLP